MIVPCGIWERWAWKRYSRCKIQIALAGNATEGFYSVWFSKPEGHTWEEADAKLRNKKTQAALLREK